MTLNATPLDSSLTASLSLWLGEAFHGRLPLQGALDLAHRGVIPFRKLSASNLENLRGIENSGRPYVDSPHVPARVLTKDGRWHERVLFVSDVVYCGHWAFSPSRSFIPVGELEIVERSALQMPPFVAWAIYDFGESGMGYVTFDLVMRDGKRIPCWYSGVADFVELPAQYLPTDIVGVENPHSKPGKDHLQDPEIEWCVHLSPPAVVRRVGPMLVSILADPERYIETRPVQRDG